MSMLNRAVIATDPDRHDWHASAARVLANALLALLAYELAAVVVEMTRMIVAGPPAAPLVAALLMPVFLLVRWVFVLPGLLPVLVAIEYVSRHAPQARVLTAIVAFTPMVWWQMTQSSGDTSAHAAVLAVTAVLFVLVARLPARVLRSSATDRGRAQPPSGPAVAPR